MHGVHDGEFLDDFSIIDGGVLVVLELNILCFELAVDFEEMYFFPYKGILLLENIGELL